MKTQAENAKKNRRFANETSFSGYEPVLTVRVPGHGWAEGSGVQFQTHFNRNKQKDIKVKYNAPHTKSGPYVSPDEFRTDKKLQALLSEPLKPDGHRAPVASGNSRKIVSVGSDIYDEHEFVERQSSEDKEIMQVLVQYLAEYHEVGVSDGLGGHFKTLIDPETAVMGALLPWSDIHSTLWENGNVPRALPKQYPETYAVLEEISLIERLRNASSPYRELQESVQIHSPDREKLKGIGRDHLDKLLRRLETEYIENGAEQLGRDSRSIRTATHLVDQVGVEQARELMEVPRKASMNADKWVCDVLRDLKNGEMEPEDIPAQSSYWDMRPPVSRDHEYDEVIKRTDRQRRRYIENPTMRAQSSTYEVVRLEQDAVVRQWYSKRPTVPFSLEHIRYCLFLQYLFTAAETRRFRLKGTDWHLRIINNGLPDCPAKYEPASETGSPRSFYQAGYQRDGVDPYEQAMAGEVTPQEIAYYFDYDSNTTLSHYGWKMAANEAASMMRFSDFQSLRHWIETGEIK
jgi:hypothetical protein